VDKSSIGLERVTVKKSPLTVQIKEGKTTKMDIGVVNASRIFGRIMAHDYKYKTPQETPDIEGRILLESKQESTGKPFKSELVEAGGLSSILVEINDGEEFLQQRTDTKGNFSFEGIRPGTWKLLVNEEDLPSDFRLEQKEFEIQVKPSEEKEVFIKAIPRLRRVQILEKEELKIERRPGKNKFLEDFLKFLRNLFKK
jgi:hypothetical protein